jgi:hypothetical protein
MATFNSRRVDGEHSPSSKLSEFERQCIREATQASAKSLAKIWNVTVGTIHKHRRDPSYGMAREY